MSSGDSGLNSTPPPQESDTGWSGIDFSLAGRRLLIAASDLIEVNVCRSFARVPGVQPWVAGLTGLRGQVLAILDLHAYLNGGEPMLRPAPVQVLVFSRSDTLYYGLVCSEFHGIKKYAAAPDGDTACDDAALAPYVSGVIRDDDGERWVINPGLLIDDANFMQFSATAASA